MRLMDLEEANKIMEKIKQLEGQMLELKDNVFNGEDCWVEIRYGNHGALIANKAINVQKIKEDAIERYEEKILSLYSQIKKL